jgi:hypothetical protein
MMKKGESSSFYTQKPKKLYPPKAVGRATHVHARPRGRTDIGPYRPTLAGTRIRATSARAPVHADSRPHGRGFYRIHGR